MSLFSSRAVRWMLLVVASLSGIALFLLATATANTALFAGNYDALVILNAVLVVLLMLVVGWQLLSKDPEARKASLSRSICGRPPTTLRPSRRSAPTVAGPHSPSGRRPTSRWNCATACAVLPP